MAQLPSKSQSRLDVAFQFEDLEPILDTMRNLMTVLEARFQQAEIIAASNEEQADILVDAGLARINEVLLPLVERIQKLTQLGFLVGASNTNLRLELAQKTFVIVAGDQRDLFTPSAFVTIERIADYNTRAIAKVLAYDKASGQLAVQILSADGDGGLHDDWMISGSPAASLASTQAAVNAGAAAARAAAAAATADADATQTAVDRAAAHSDRLIADDKAAAAAASAAAAKLSEGKVTTPVIYGGDQDLLPAERNQAKKNIRADGWAIAGYGAAAKMDPSIAGRRVYVTNGPYEMILPDVTEMDAGEILDVTNIGQAPVTFKPQGASVFYSSAFPGATSFVVDPGATVNFWNDGGNWIVGNPASTLKTAMVDRAQAFTALEVLQLRKNLKLAASTYVYLSADTVLTRADVGTTFYVDATRQITLPKVADTAVGDTIEIFAYAGASVLKPNPADANQIVGLPGSTPATLTLTPGVYTVKRHDTIWRVYNPPNDAVLRSGDTMSGDLVISKAGFAGIRMVVPGKSDHFWRAIDNGRMQLCDGAQTVEYMSVGTDGSISTRQFGDLNNRIESRIQAYVAGYIPNSQATAGDAGGVVVRRDGPGRMRVVDGPITSWGYCLNNPDGRLGRFVIKNGYIETYIDGSFYGITINASDIRFKDNIEVVEGRDELSKIAEMKFFSFDWKPGAIQQGHKDFGVIAQQLKAIDENWVLSNLDGNLQLDLQGLILSNARATQQLQQMVAALSARVAELEARA